MGYTIATRRLRFISCFSLENLRYIGVMVKFMIAGSQVRKRIAALEKALSLSLWSLANASPGGTNDRDELRRSIDTLRNDIESLKEQCHAMENPR